ncbi:MAG: SUMF1/EgtB/PvdO family nonheme iron enzyme [Deltaproteobacteria bacterium]|nr:SUMF1/EgtB/PvdO family nonheme iron enzyme [Deltaproteobacteria bacterium]
MSLRAVSCLLLFFGLQPGCSLLKPKGQPQEEQRKSPSGGGGIELRDDDCKADLPALLPLYGMDPVDRDLLYEISRTRVVAVRLVVDACHVRIKPLDRCSLDAAYRPIVATSHHASAASDGRALFRQSPLGAPAFAARLDDEQAVLVRARESGRLSVPADASIRRGDFADGDCARATHVVRALHVGFMSVDVGPREALSNAASSFRQGGSIRIDATNLELDGKWDACDQSESRKAIAPGCDRPVAVELAALESFTDEAATSKMATQRMITIPGGVFFRGAKSGVADAPGRKLDVPTFQIDRFETTAGEYGACVRVGACTAAGSGAHCTGGVLGKEKHPINCINWLQANAYCQFAGKRLPSETEWEKAARGADGRTHPWGETWPPPRGSANLGDVRAHDLHPHWRFIEGYDDGHAGTSPVDAFDKAITPYGVSGTIGNVLEWTADFYDPKVYGATSGATRVLRGASFGDSEKEHAATYRRVAYRPAEWSMHFGVRCARTGDSTQPGSRAADELPPGESPTR